MEDATSAAADDPDDADLMRRAAHGDRDAFAALYRRHQARVYRFARLMTGSSTAAEDIVQEVFLVVMRDAARYDPARAALTSYLYGVARHQTRRRRARDRQFVGFDGRRPTRLNLWPTTTRAQRSNGVRGCSNCDAPSCHFHGGTARSSSSAICRV